MAQSRGTSNGPGWTDVAVALASFEQINKVHLEFRMGAAVHKGEPDLTMEVIAHESKETVGDLSCLASARCSAGAQGFRTMEALTLFLLYQIDFQLAREEFVKTIHPAG